MDKSILSLLRQTLSQCRSQCIVRAIWSLGRHGGLLWHYSACIDEDLEFLDLLHANV